MSTNQEPRNALTISDDLRSIPDTLKRLRAQLQSARNRLAGPLRSSDDPDYVAAIRAERAALPADLTVAARLYAESLGEALKAAERAIQAEGRPHLAALETTEAPLQEAQYAVSMGRPGQSDYDGKLEALMVIVQDRQPHLDRLEDPRRLSRYWQTFVIAALETPESAKRPGGLKLIDGRPSPNQIAAFAAQTGRAVA